MEVPPSPPRTCAQWATLPHHEVCRVVSQHGRSTPMGGEQLRWTAAVLSQECWQQAPPPPELHVQSVKPSGVLIRLYPCGRY
eukprot:468479-Amphidinium_carterae.1